MDEKLFRHIQDMQYAAYFRQTASGGFSHVVNSPYLPTPIASAFERLSAFADPIVEVARLGTHEVHNVVWGIDPAQDSLDLISSIPAWTRDGAITIRHMAGGRC